MCTVILQINYNDAFRGALHFKSQKGVIFSQRVQFERGNLNRRGHRNTVNSVIALNERTKSLGTKRQRIFLGATFVILVTRNNDYREKGTGWGKVTKSSAHCPHVPAL